MAEVIDIARIGKPRTKIMQEVNLSFKQLQYYMPLLCEAKLLEKSLTDGKEVYKSTQKGIDFMEKQHQILNMIDLDSQNKCENY